VGESVCESVCGSECVGVRVCGVKLCVLLVNNTSCINLFGRSHFCTPTLLHFVSLLGKNLKPVGSECVCIGGCVDVGGRCR